MHTFCFQVKTSTLTFGQKMVIFDGWGGPPGCVAGYGHISLARERRRREMCLPLHSIVSFSVVLFVLLFDLVQNYWKWRNHWVSL